MNIEQLTKKVVIQKDTTLTINAAAVLKLLQTLTGPASGVRELLATISQPGNCLGEVTDEVIALLEAMPEKPVEDDDIVIEII